MGDPPTRRIVLRRVVIIVVVIVRAGAVIKRLVTKLNHRFLNLIFEFDIVFAVVGLAAIEVFKDGSKTYIGVTI